MKVIATVVESSWSGKYLVEASKEELHRIAGDTNWRPRVGDDFSVCDHWDHLAKLRYASSEAARLAKNLNAMADLLSSEVQKVKSIVDAEEKAG